MQSFARPNSASKGGLGRNPRTGLGSVVVALAATCAMVGCSGSGVPQSRASTSIAMAAVVSCPGGSVNSGTADSKGDTQPVTDIRDHASKWAKATGFADRFSAATVTVQEDQQMAFARFEDQAHLRGKLTYRMVAGGWTIDTLEYC